MNVEELTLIIDLVKQLTDDAIWGFVFYILTTSTLPILLGYGLGFTFIFLIYKTLKSFIIKTQRIGRYEELLTKMDNHIVYLDFEIEPREEKAFNKLKDLLNKTKIL